MSDIYITGHRNPDVDSICSALGYANLKSLIDPMNNYIPVCCSKLSEGTKKLLEALQIESPEYKRNVYPKVKDVMLTSGQQIEADAYLSDYAGNYDESAPPAMPVFQNGEFCGMLSVDDVVRWTMDKMANEGKIETDPTVKELIGDPGPELHPDDLFEDAKATLVSSKKRGLPIIDNGVYIGYVTRRCFLNVPRYNVILVDHNEPSQSIKGIEAANIVEIIDHHRLNALKTDLPLFIDAEPLGSTCTIVYQLFLRNGIRPNPQIARILLTGIVADTLILKSPTTTRLDEESAAILAAMCGVNVAQFGAEMFSNIEGLKSRDPESAISADFKIYRESGVKIGIGQCEVTTLKDLEEYSSIYLSALEEYRKKSALDWALLMITDVIKEHSVLLSTDYKAEPHLQYAKFAPHSYDMPGVMSRKKQLLPEILHSIGG